MNQRQFVGVDTHKNTIACYVNGKFKEFPTTARGYEKALEWAGNKQWAIEGAYCFGKPFASFLIKQGCKVYEINSLATKNWRNALTINKNKNDYGDAKVISIFADTTNPNPVSLSTIELKEKITARNLLIKQRTEVINSIKMLFNTRGEKLPFNDLTTNKALTWLLNQEDMIIKSFSDVLKTLSSSIKTFETEIEQNLPEKAKKLTELTGIKALTAAVIYTETKGNLISKEALANYAGVAPIENSSGKQVKHRNNKGGNRTLNSVFFRLSLHQSRHDEKGKAYYEKKLKEGKTQRHARKCLSRQLVNVVFKILTS